jgi:hypothetical protein
MQIKKKLAVITIVLSLAISQTGCLIGIFVWPLWMVGGVVGLTGVGLTTGGFIFKDRHLTCAGVGFMAVGAFLDSENPGRADALNDLPMTAEVAKNAGVTLADLKNYNRNLDQVRRAGLELAEDLRQQVRRESELSQYRNQDELSRDPQIERLAVKYGFENGADLFNSFRYKKLPAANLKRFADHQYLTPGEAKLLLYYGFGVQSE